MYNPRSSAVPTLPMAQRENPFSDLMFGKEGVWLRRCKCSHRLYRLCKRIGNYWRLINQPRHQTFGGRRLIFTANHLSRPAKTAWTWSKEASIIGGGLKGG